MDSIKAPSRTAITIAAVLLGAAIILLYLVTVDNQPPPPLPSCTCGYEWQGVHYECTGEECYRTAGGAAVCITAESVELLSGSDYWRWER